MTMTAKPFSVTDRIDPEKDIDENELIKTVNAMDDIDNRPLKFLTPGQLDKPALFQQVRDYQQKRAMAADAVVKPKGPTAKRVAAEKHAQNARLPQNVPIPIKSGVGPGQPNRAGDVRTIANGLTLAGHRAVLPPAPDPDAADPRGAEQIRPITMAFQKAQGETDDGTVLPGGPTQKKLSFIATPHVVDLVGADPERPKPFTPQEPAYVGRVLNSRRSTIRTFQQDPRTLPTKEEHEAAVGLLSRIGEAVREMIGVGQARAQNRGVGGPARGQKIPSWHEQGIGDRIYGTMPKQRPQNVPDDEIRAIEDEERRRRAADIYRRGISDEQFAFGRPRFNEGDPYSGDATYGDPDGR